MSANNTVEKGRALFASHREVAWHGLGTVFTREITDYREMLTEAGLADWDVRFTPLSTLTGTVLDRWQAVIRNSATGEEIVMGVVGRRYTIWQNESAFSFLQSLSDGARWETAGALGDNGERVFGSLAFEREIVLDPTGVADTVKTYALVSTSHDGSGSATAGLTPVRVVCQNTLNAALGNLSNVMKFRHTASIEERAAQAAEFFRFEHIYFDRFEESAAALYAAKFSDKQFENAFTTLFPKPEDNVKGALTKWENKRGNYFGAWNAEANAGIKGTAWGAWQAMTEANQWSRNIQDTDKGSENFFSAGAGFDGPTNKFRQETLDLVARRANVDLVSV